MKSPILATAVILILATAIIFIQNTTQQKIVVIYPVKNQIVKTKFNLQGEISSRLLQESAFGIQVISGDGRTVLEQVILVSAPSYSRYISIPIQFNEDIDITGVTEETEICYGKSTVRLMSLKKDISTSISVFCGSKL
ncbi:MAG: hypothetical protein WAX38_02515 [Minisyncoccia bacterium]